MGVIREESFIHENKEYHLQLIEGDSTYAIKAFGNGNEGILCEVSKELASDHETTTGEKIFDKLFENAKNEIIARV